MSGLLLVLLLGGVTLELAGLVVTFREVRSRAQAAVAFEEMPPPLRSPVLGLLVQGPTESDDVAVLEERESEELRGRVTALDFGALISRVLSEGRTDFPFKGSRYSAAATSAPRAAGGQGRCFCGRR